MQMAPVKKTRQSSIITLTYLAQLKSKPEYDWKKIKQLHKNYSYFFLMCYYWNGIFNNKVHKLRYMDLNSKINLAYSDIEGLKQMTSDESRYQQEQLDDLRKLRDYYKLLNTEPDIKDIKELNLQIKDNEQLTKEDVYKELNELTDSLTRKNIDYLHNIKNEQTRILYKVEEIIYEFHDLMWIANAPMEQFIENYLIKRNRIIHIKNFFKITNQLPSCIVNTDENEQHTDENEQIIGRQGFSVEKIQDNDSGIESQDINLDIITDNIDYLDAKFLTKYIKNYNEDQNEIDVNYSLGHNHILIDSERELDIYNVTSELITIKDFIKVSVNTNDQLPFKVLLIFCNALLLIGEYLWTTILKEELGL
jgi:hypothetical protein